MPKINEEAVKAAIKMAEEAEKQWDALTTEPRRAPKIPGEVGYFTAWLFNHFDSRGGSFLVEAPHVIKAIQLVISEVFQQDPEDTHMINNTYEDLVGRFEVVVLGEELPESGELLEAYGGKHNAFHLQSRYGDEGIFGNEGHLLVLSSVHKTDDVFHDPVALPEMGDGHRLSDRDLGGDACGLWRIREEQS